MNRRPFLRFPLIALCLLFCLQLAAAVFVSLPAFLVSANAHQRWTEIVLLCRAAAGVRLVTLSAGCFLVGLLRVFPRHPKCSTKYGAWLRSTPWRSGVNLPLGPINLVWEDLLLCVPLFVLSFWDFNAMAFVPIAALLAGYSLISVATLKGDQAIWTGFAWIFLWSCTTFGGLWIWLVFAAILGLSQWAMRKSIAGFPLDTGESLKEIHKRWTSALSWPMKQISPVPPGMLVRPPTGWAGAALVGWLAFVFLTLIAHDSPGDARDAAWDIPFVCMFVAFSRAVIYCGQQFPPISWWGRLWTGRWIIPGYDVIFVTPLVMCATALILPAVLPLNAYISAALTLSVVVGMGLTGRPSLQRWQLTGHSRLVAPALRTSKEEQRKLR